MYVGPTPKREILGKGGKYVKEGPPPINILASPSPSDSKTHFGVGEAFKPVFALVQCTCVIKIHYYKK